MQMFEVDAVIEAHVKDYHNKWEQTRYICYFITASQSTKPVDIHKMMPFPWDEVLPEKPQKVFTSNDRERLVKLAENKMINYNGQQ